MCEAGRQHSHRSPGRAPILASDARAECSSAAALSSTPFGTPVDPEVRDDDRRTFGQLRRPGPNGTA